MEELKMKAENLTEHVSDLLDSYYKLAAVTATEKATNIGSGILGAVVIGILGFFIVFFAGFGLAWWLGNVINSRAGGFLLVSGFFLLVMVILLAIRKKIVFPFFRNSILRKIYG
jgi:hypothetical protein